MSNPFKLKSGNSPTFKKMGASPTKHKKDGSWRGHEHTSWLGKLTAKINEGFFESPESDKTRLQADLERKKEDIVSIGTDIKEGKTIGTTKKAKSTIASTDVSTDVSEDTRKHKINIKQQEGYLPTEDWKKVEENVGGKEEMDKLLEKQKTLEKGSKEWNINQNIINKAYGDKKRHPEE